MGKIVDATERVHMAYEAAYLEKVFDISGGEAAKAADRATMELKKALSDFLGKSVILKVDISFSLKPDEDREGLCRAASELEKTNETTFRDCLAKFLLLLKLAIGA